MTGCTWPGAPGGGSTIGDGPVSPMEKKRTVVGPSPPARSSRSPVRAWSVSRDRHAESSGNSGRDACPTMRANTPITFA